MDVASVAQRGAPTLPADAPRAELTGPPALGAVRCQTQGPITYIGSRRDCQLSLPVPDISKLHCVVINDGTSLLVRDLCSRSGTFLGDQQVCCAPLTPGAALRVGSVTVTAEIPDTLLGESRPDHPPMRVRSGANETQIDLPAAVIGRRHGCDLIVDSPDTSLAHTMLYWYRGRLAVCDLGSRSGTFVNGQRIDLAWLAAGDFLTIGGEEIEILEAGVDFAQDDEAAHDGVPEQRDPAAPDLPQAAEPGLAAAFGNMSLESLDDLFAALHEKASSLRAEHQAREETLNAERSAFEAEVARQRQEAEHLDALEAQLDQQTHALDAREAELRELDEQLANQARDLDARAAELDSLRASLDEASAALDTRADELSDREAQVDVRREATEALAQSLDARERELQSKEEALLRREREDADAVRKIDEFRAALSAASRMLGQSGAPDADEADTPAPVIKQPMFGATRGRGSNSTRSRRKAPTPPNESDSHGTSDASLPN